jgi:hypothetical protein
VLWLLIDVDVSFFSVWVGAVIILPSLPYFSVVGETSGRSKTTATLEWLYQQGWPAATRLNFRRKTIEDSQQLYLNWL